MISRPLLIYENYYEMNLIKVSEKWKFSYFNNFEKNCYQECQKYLAILKAKEGYFEDSKIYYFYYYLL